MGKSSERDGCSYDERCFDVVVVGGGMAGVSAAFTAFDGGASVAVVDKGPFGHSGNTGVNWGQSFVTAETSTDDGVAGTRFLTLDVMGILDQKLARNVIRAQIKEKPRTGIERTGCIFQRDDEGNVVGLVEENAVCASPDAHYTQSAQLVRKLGIPVFDNTMMLDLLLGEAGEAAGVAALDVRTGSFVVLRAKKIILATGGYHWAKGVTAGSPESTGDAHACLLRRGVAFKDMEFPQYDFTGVRPFGWRPDPEQDIFEIASCFPVNGEIHHRLRNRRGEAFSQAVAAGGAGSGLSAFQHVLVACAKELYAGGGTDGDGVPGGLLFDLEGIMDEPSSVAFPTYKGHLLNTEHNLDYEFPRFCEVVANEYSSCGTPAVDAETCETAIPGVYAVFVGLSAMSSTFSWAQGYLAARDAAMKASEAPLAPLRAEEAEAVFSQARGLLSARPSESVRSTEVVRSIQRAFYRGFPFIKDERAMRAALGELERICDEDLPRMCCADASPRFNRDWRCALEAGNMLLCSLGSLSAGLVRKESRPPFFRFDFPRMDNDAFLCFLWTSLDERGSWRVERGDIVESVMTRDEIAAQLDDIDISVPNAR